MPFQPFETKTSIDYYELTIYSIFHSSILRVFALKFTPILNNWRGSEAKGSA